jgi:hypothetical protein
MPYERTGFNWCDVKKYIVKSGVCETSSNNTEDVILFDVFIIPGIELTLCSRNGRTSLTDHLYTSRWIECLMGEVER